MYSRSLRTILAIAAAFVAPTTLVAQTARMTFDDGGKRVPLKIDRANLEVAFSGNVAETTLTLRFVNHTKRMLEGEFVMQLPDGATVSSYALEVNGKLRESVSVERRKARTAYETIKRKMIDPGLVEREAGNVYRTRVFPVPANGTKEMRIGYVENLAHADESLHYKLPLKFHHPLDEFTCTLTRSGRGTLRIKNPEGLKIVSKGNDQYAGTAKDLKLDDELGVEWKKDRAKVDILMENDGHSRTWFQASGIFPKDMPGEVREQPEAVTLIWDASDSARKMDQEKIFALLKTYFATLPRFDVDLHLLRNELRGDGAFDNWDALENRLRKVVYDGATDFGKLPTRLEGADAVIFVTDGKASLPAPIINIPRQPFFLINAGTSDVPSALTLNLERRSNTRIELGRGEGIETAMRKLTMHPPRVALKGIALRDIHIDFDGSVGSPFQITGWRSGAPTREFGVVFSQGDTDLEQRFDTKTVRRRPAGRSLVRRSWAQKHLAYMEGMATYHAQDIIRFASEHTLVSNHTSLIVLERMQDYVTYRIPPPEPDLRRVYEAKIAASGNPSNLADREDRAFRLAWQKRLRWFKKEFPWADVALWAPLQQVGIWKKALEKTFSAEERKALGGDDVLKWHGAAMAAIERRAKLKTQEDLDAWTGEIAKLLEKSTGFWRVDTKLPPWKDGPVAVSVQGLVNQPGKVRSKGPLTLREAVKQAGGPNFVGSMTNVALYRGAGRVVFNTLSKQFEPVQLRPGDMLVVGQRIDYNDSGGADPFSANPSVPIAPRDQPAITREGAPTFLGGDDPFSDPRANRGSPPGMPRNLSVKMSGTATVTAITDKKSEALVTLEKAIKENADVRGAYAEAKGGMRRGIRFYVAAARMLFEYDRKDLGTQVLSNLIEYRNDFAAIRAYAMWLAEFSSPSAARLVLRDFTWTDRMSSPTQLDAARLAVRGGDPANAGNEYERFIDRASSEGQTAVAVIARTEMNAIRALNPDEDRPVVGEGTENLDCDVRVILTSDTGTVSLKVTDPVGEQLNYHGTTPCGGSLTRTHHYSEYMMRRGLPGRYKIGCWNHDPDGTSTVQVGMFTNWGRNNQTEKWVTILVTGRELDIGSLEFVFGGEEENKEG